MASGDALQFGELADQARLQVGLGQQRGAARQRRVHAHLRRDGLGQRGHARDLVGQRAEPGLVGHAGQPGVHRLQPLLHVLDEEELGVGEARPDHPLVALADLAVVGRVDVGDADEACSQAAGPVEDREELLVGLHRRHQRFLRHRQEFLLERARHRARPFVEADHLLEVVLVDARAAAGGGGSGLDLLDDARAALLRIDQHARAAQRFDIVLRGGQPDLLVVQEAVAAAHAVGADAEQLAFHHLLAQQHDQPQQRTGEGIVVVAPAHRLGDRHAGHGLAQDLRQQAGGARARAHRPVHEALALGVAGLLQRGPLHAGLGGEALQRAGRLAVGVQGDVEVGPQHLAALLGLLGRNARQQHRQPARRVQRPGRAALDRDAAPVQRRQHAVEEGLGQAGQGLDRQFLGAQFDQQRRHRGGAHAGLACEVGAGAENGL